MYCPKCGLQISDSSLHCPYCNAVIPIEFVKQPQVPDISQQSVEDQPAVQKKKFYALPCSLGAIAAILIFVGVFLPYMNAVGKNVSLMDGKGDAYFFIGFALLGLIFAFSDIGIGQIVVGVLAILLMAYEWSSISNYTAMISKGVGYYSILVGSVLLILGGNNTIVIRCLIKAAIKGQ